jgi:hypothetical protein
MSDGNERSILDQSFQQHAISNEDRIKDLERDVNGRGGIYAVMQELKKQMEDLSQDFKNKFEKFDDRMDTFEKNLEDVKHLAQGEKDIRTDKEQKALDNAKPVAAMKYNIAEKVVWAILVGLIGWLGWLVALSRSVTK